jgi:hypothetical protein
MSSQRFISSLPKARGCAAGSRRAFVLLPDLMTAMWIVALLITALSISLGAERRFERRLGDQWTALRTAESVLSTLQQNPAACGFASTVNITRISPGWTRVSVNINHASATLIGPTKETP